MELTYCCKLFSLVFALPRNMFVSLFIYLVFTISEPMTIQSFNGNVMWGVAPDPTYSFVLKQKSRQKKSEVSNFHVYFVIECVYGFLGRKYIV